MVSGDRVRLAPSVAKTFMSKTRGKNSGVDWLHRTGTVATIMRTGIAVQWDDRATLDQWPHSALQLVEPHGQRRL